MYKYINITQQGPLNHDVLLLTFLFSIRLHKHTVFLTCLHRHSHFRQLSRETSSLWKTESMFPNICCLIWIEACISLTLLHTSLVVWLSLANETFTNLVCYFRAADLRTIMRSGLPMFTILSQLWIMFPWEKFTLSEKWALSFVSDQDFVGILQRKQAPVDRYIYVSFSLSA